MTTPDELRSVGAVQAFIAVSEGTNCRPSLNFLYALVGALEDRDWRDVAKEDRGDLLLALEGHRELQQLFNDVEPEKVTTEPVQLLRDSTAR